MLVLLTAHLARGDPVQFTVDHFHDLVRRFLLAGAPLLEKTGNAVGIVGHFRL